METQTSTQTVLHLPNFSDSTRTLCGLSISDVSIGGYCEHLDENRECPGWVRTIFGANGKVGEPCPVCLFRRAPMLATDRSLTCRSIPLFLMICPAPQTGQDEFDIKAVSLSDRYKVLEPSVTGQYAHGPAMALILRLHIVPEPVPLRGTYAPAAPLSARAYGKVRRSRPKPANTTIPKPQDDNA